MNGINRERSFRLRCFVVAAFISHLVVACVSVSSAVPASESAEGPLTIRGVSVVGVTETFAAFRWTVDRPARSHVEISLTSDDTAVGGRRSQVPATTHIQALDGLTPGTTYHFRVVAQDSEGQRAVSSGHTFVTNDKAAVSIARPVAELPVVAVPASIDSTGADDASGPLNRWLSNVPDGSTIRFKRGGTYRMDHGLEIENRRDLVLDGNGATLSANPTTIDMTTPLDSLIALMRSQNILIRDLRFKGNSPTPGVFQPNNEHNHAILVLGGRAVEIDDVTVTGMHGDAFHLHGWATDVYIHDSSVESVDRNGLTIIAAENVIVERVSFDRSGYVTFDIEPNSSDQGAQNVVFRGNTAGSWSDSFFSALGAEHSVVRDITVTGNTVTEGSLRTHVYLPTGREDIRFTDNTSLQEADGPVLRFAYIDGLWVTGNDQPLSGGELASIADSTNVVYVP